jgi:hypothetical protein
MNNTFLAFDIIPSNIKKPIGVEVWFNNNLIADYAQVVETKNVVCNFDDTVEQSHCVKILVKNKTAEHTAINADGKILQDSLLEIKNFNLEEIEIDKIVQEKAVYNHDFNGSGNQVSDSFYGSAGCNGSIELTFTAPAYLWLLENM